MSEHSVGSSSSHGLSATRIIGVALLAILAIGTIAGAPASAAQANATMQRIKAQAQYPVVELRRYTTTPGDAQRFAAYFDNYFPQAFQQLGAMVLGQFVERTKPNAFTWLRGYPDMASRPIINSAFYYGPVWKEHKAKVNAILPDSDNVLLLTSIDNEGSVEPMPMFDPIADAGTSRGIAIMHLFPVQDSSAAMRAAMRAALGAYNIAGIHAQALLISLDEPNNFPQLPVRIDGPWVVWVGMAQDDEAEMRLQAIARIVADRLRADGRLRDDDEYLLLDPTAMSRMRWRQTEAR